MSRDKFPHLSYIFMTIIIMVNYRLCSKLFENLSFVSLALVYIFKERENPALVLSPPACGYDMVVVVVVALHGHEGLGFCR